MNQDLVDTINTKVTELKELFYEANRLCQETSNGQNKLNIDQANLRDKTETLVKKEVELNLRLADIERQKEYIGRLNASLTIKQQGVETEISRLTQVQDQANKKIEEANKKTAELASKVAKSADIDAKLNEITRREALLEKSAILDRNRKQVLDEQEAILKSEKERLQKWSDLHKT